MPESRGQGGEGGRLGALEVVDRYFLENRARLIDLAAFLDRVDRCADAASGQQDYRYQALVRGLGLVLEGDAPRTQRVLRSLSDPSREPIAAAGEQGAQGAHSGGGS